MKALIPSAREKKRYLLIDSGCGRKVIEKVLFEFLGVLGMSEISLEWLKVEGGKCVFSINRKGLDKVRSAFCLSKKRILVRRVSGTLKGLGL